MPCLLLRKEGKGREINAKEKGISLIVLVITIIVLAILATTTVITLNNAGLIPFTQNAAFKGRVSTYLEELSHYHATRLIEDKTYKSTELNIGVPGEGGLASVVLMAANENPTKITDVITSMTVEDEAYFYIQEGKLRVKTSIGDTKLRIARDLGVLSDNEQDSMYDEVVEITPQSMFAYTISNGEATINGFASHVVVTPATDAITEIAIPYEIEHNGTKYPVTKIGNDAFGGITALTKAVLPTGITDIGESAFRDCWSLKSITIPAGITSIGDDTFSYSGLTNVILPESVTSIGSYAFYDCGGLANIILPENVTSIGNGAFNKTAYYNDTNNWENGILYIGNYLIKANTTITGGAVIKSGIKCIAEYAFHNCSNLTSVNYQGTRAQWNAIAFGEKWDRNTGNYVIHCTDGNIAKS